MSKLAKLIGLTLLFKSVAWSLLVPLWHFPDEQAHFGHVSFIAEGGDLSRHGRGPDMTEEIYTSLGILGTQRDEHGNNRFTFHPEYRLDYSNTTTGLREAEIKSLPLSTRKNFVITESAYYPHFYYQVSALIYKLFYQADLFVRVFVVRLFWLAVHFLMIWLVYKSTKIIWPQSSLDQLVVTIMVAFQPMLTFVASGVSSDNLHNLLFTAVIYFSLSIIKKPHWGNFLGLVLALGIGMINKQQFFIAWLVVLPVLLLARRYFLLLPLSLLVAYILAPQRIGNLVKIFLSGSLPYLSLMNSSSVVNPSYGLIDHLVGTVRHTVREVVPWYWGVFNWLGVVLPRWVNRLLNRLAIVSVVGLAVWLVKKIKAKKLIKQDYYLLFLFWAALVYFGVLTLWGWTFVRENGFPFGIQGRYYFPVIAAHMILLFVGIDTLTQRLGQSINHLVKALLAILFIFLNWIGFYTVAKAYYDLSSLHAFIIQASQYKPFFAKGWWLMTPLTLFLVLSAVVVVYLIVYAFEKTTDR